MRLESDFDPGNLTVPEISLMGCSTISGTVDGFSAVATEAETLNGLLLTVKIRFLFKTHKDFDELLAFLESRWKEHDVEAEILGREVGNCGTWILCPMLLACAILRISD